MSDLGDVTVSPELIRLQYRHRPIFVETPKYPNFFAMQLQVQLT